MALLAVICSFEDSDYFKEFFAWVITLNPNVMHRNYLGLTALHAAAVKGNTYAMELLKQYAQQKGVPLAEFCNAKSIGDETALTRSAKYRAEDSIAVLKGWAEVD